MVNVKLNFGSMKYSKVNGKPQSFQITEVQDDIILSNLPAASCEYNTF